MKEHYIDFTFGQQEDAYALTQWIVGLCNPALTAIMENLEWGYRVHLLYDEAKQPVLTWDSF